MMNARHIKSKHVCCSKREDGAALLVALFALLTLSLIGFALLTTASTEVLISDNFKRSRAAYYAAEGGTEEARQRLSSKAGANRIDDLFTDANAASTVIYIRANNTIDPTSGNASTNRYYDPEYASIKVRDQSGTQTATTSSISGITPIFRTSTISSNIPFSWIKVTRKTELLAGQNVDTVSSNQSVPVHYGILSATGSISQYVKDAANQLTHDQLKTNPVYLITAMALDSTGAQRKIQTEVTIPPPISTTAAINSYEEVDFSGNLDISGNDECNGGVTKVYGVSSASTIDSLTPSETVVGAPPPAPASPTGPSLCPGCPFNYDVPTLINQLKNSGRFQNISNAPNISCSGTPVTCGGSNGVMGTPPNVPPPSTATNTPDIKYYYSPGDLDLQANNTIGYGVLIVDGDVTFHGGVYYEGIIIAKGTFNFLGGGGNNINIRGAVIAGESINDTTTDVGGSVDVQYNSCSIANVFKEMPMIQLTFKDRALY